MSHAMNARSLLIPALACGSVDGRAEDLYLPNLGSQFSPHTRESYRPSILGYRARNPGLKQAREVGFDGWILPAIRQPRKRQPRPLLDDVVSDVPAIIISWTGHQRCVNSKALELAGITKDTPDLPGTEGTMRAPAARFQRELTLQGHAGPRCAAEASVLGGTKP